ncbi:MAG: DUF4433 domain-containing protein [Nitrospinota bacterium]
MRREELDELHYTVPIATVPSILKRGILSHERAKRIPHQSVANPRIQEIRRRVMVPGGRRLHEYVNLYFCARNPMLRWDVGHYPHETLCVLRVGPGVLDLAGVVITDQNAASTRYARFAPAPHGLEIVDRDMVFAEFWTHPSDQIAEWRHSSAKCAEVLVPDCVDPRYIFGAYVSCEHARTELQGRAPSLDVTVDPPMFFRP